jgi:putative ABC transport system permease protein
LFGLWPAWQAARTDINAALQAGSFGSSETKTARRSRDWLVIVEVALTLLLLSAAGLVLKSFAKMQNTQLGFDPQQLLTLRIELPFTKYQELPPILNFTNGLLDDVRKLPGVQSAALSSNPPLIGAWQINFQPEGAPPTDPSQQPSADYEVVQGDYFAALKINLIRGRTFNEHDRADSTPVVIIDQTLADMTFKGQDPLGKRLMVDTESDVVDGGARLYEIVGVVPHLKFRGYDDATPIPSFFFPETQVGRTNLTLHVRASGNVKRLENRCATSSPGSIRRSPCSMSGRWKNASRKPGRRIVCSPFSSRSSRGSRCSSRRWDCTACWRIARRAGCARSLSALPSERDPRTSADS